MADQPTLDEFRDEVVAFLDANAKLKQAEEQQFVWGEGDDDVAMFEEVDPERGAARAGRGQGVAGQALRRRPRLDHRRRASTAAASCPAPTTGSTARSRPSTRCPTRASSASASAWWRPRSWPTPPTHVKDAYLPSMYRGDLVGCQLFSEPGAGSDLAGLQTKAERDGDEWVITGQKVWTSGAQYSDIGEIICRTDPDLPKHKGLTGFVVDMQAPGVEVRPLRQMTGGAVVQRGVLQRGPGPRRPPPRRRQPGLDRRPHHAHERAARRSAPAAAAAAWAWPTSPASPRCSATSASTRTARASATS